jgi:hypothetical protein
MRAREYFNSDVLTSSVFTICVSLAFGVVVAGWHTWRSFICALIFYTAILLLFFPRGILFAGIIFYALGWFVGLRLFPCNRGRPLREMKGQPWRYNCGNRDGPATPLTARGMGMLPQEFHEVKSPRIPGASS